MLTNLRANQFEFDQSGRNSSTKPNPKSSQVLPPFDQGCRISHRIKTQKLLTTSLKSFRAEVTKINAELD